MDDLLKELQGPGHRLVHVVVAVVAEPSCEVDALELLGLLQVEPVAFLVLLPGDGVVGLVPPGLVGLGVLVAEGGVGR